MDESEPVTDHGEADREDNGEVVNVSRKALKRKARAEQRADWKAPVMKSVEAAQKAKKKRGSHRPKMAPAAAPLDPNASEAEIKAARLARKNAELEDFRARSAKGATVVLDLAAGCAGASLPGWKYEWEEMMQPKEVKSLIQQLLYCYGANRRAQQPVRLCFSGVKEGSQTHEGLSKQSGYESWEVQKLSTRYIDEFPKEKLVYLTADAEEKIHSFDPELVYVIGGIDTCPDLFL
eukprot:Skav206764  [mRNA]  locus=scaffold167:445456:446674:+ [translate_table: standard]